MDAAVPFPGCALENDFSAVNSGNCPPWYRRRGYAHFDRPLTPAQSIKLATDPLAVARRAFLPFLAFDINQRRYKKKADGSREQEIKRRLVAIASHGDACIFSYYAYLLKEPYEEQLRYRGLASNVIAYRRFDPPKCNIHFANEAFAEIERRGGCVAIALDIEKFFDTIPHNALKRQWCQLLDTSKLPPNHYAVFKAVTRWSKVERDSVYEILGIGRHRSENWNRQDTLCTPSEFRQKIRGTGLIQPGYKSGLFGPVGIPQGSPISAVLSNIVMLEADTAIAEMAKKRDVYYRRYCDDILLIGSFESVAETVRATKAAMHGLGVTVNDAKTKQAHFEPDANGLLIASEPLQYLGFTFDGQRILVRSQTIAKFIQRMKRGVQSAKRAAKAADKRGGNRLLRRQDLYSRFSHLGPTKAMLCRGNTSKRNNSFYTYAMRSALVMDRAEIKRQLRKHWTRLNAEIRLADNTE